VSKKGRKATAKKAAITRQIARQQQIQPKKARKYLRLLKNTKTQMSFLIGVLGFLFVVWPRVSVSPGEVFELYDPFKTPFVIKNDGYLPITNINYSLAVDNAEFEREISFTNVSFLNFGDSISKLAANRSSAIFIRRTIGMPPGYLKSAEVNIVLNYKPYLIPYTFKETFRFKTEKKTSGAYVWLETYK
jgi:hypothetical protein